ncbi:hypothetical protein [Spirillospora sp. NBC_01491]|uniref:hypothetical protein n=1 Tax=Spirillospora sp. NBC_01491 TaxID=2976007 RepID=UPI002E2EF762|nr:hypothetical protein [Spirillospora sp. NBC_01491]
MRKITRNTLTATAVITAGLGLTALPAHAVDPWTVTPGGAITGNQTRPLVATDTTTGANIVCTVSTASGTAASGSGLPGAGIAQLSSVAFSTPGNPSSWCTGPVGIVVKVTATGLPWSFNAATYAGGVTTGTLTGVKSTIHGSDECDATVAGPGTSAGTISGTYTNSTATLAVSGGNLEVKTADADCDPALINVGDKITLTGAYKVNPALTITHP